MFTLEEQETILRFDLLERKWHIYSRVSKHIRRMQKMGFRVEVLAATEAGTPLEAKGTAEEKQISFRKVIEITEEQRQQMSERARQTFSRD